MSQIFGFAASAAYIRCGSGSNTSLVLQALSTGLGATTGDGAYVYNSFLQNSGVLLSSGFGGSSLYQTQLESAVASFEPNPYTKIGVSAIIYAFANFPNVDESLITKYINNYCQNVTLLLGEGNIYFPESGLDYVLGQINLPLINSGIAQSPENVTGVSINYNWYNAAPLFVNPNPDSTLIRDVENQYYYLTGKLIYSSLPTAQPCIEYIRNITTPTGMMAISVVQNTPCYDPSSYIGPYSGISFFREFNDGPGTSGYLDLPTIQEFVSLDEKVLYPSDYSNNVVVTYSHEKDSSGLFVFLDSGMIKDIPGFYNSGSEYGYGITNLITSDEHCSWTDYQLEGAPLMRMHQGDSQQKWYVYKYCIGFDGYGNCTGCGYQSGLYNWTGWKFALAKLTTPSKNLLAINMNPQMGTGEILNRVLNLDNYQNMDGSVTSPYLGVYDSGDGLLTCNTYVGPPQLSGTSTMPGFVFCQTFDSTNFPSTGTFANIKIRAAVENSDRSFSISSYDLASGQDGTHHPAFGGGIPDANIIQVIYSSGQYDDIMQSCLAIGNNFGNIASGTSSLESNAGFLYTGYTYYISGNPVNIFDLMQSGSSTIGAKYSQLKYVNGYTSGVTNFNINDQYAYIITGNTQTGINYTGKMFFYSYFNDGILGAVNTGWTGNFAPIPDVVNNNLPYFNPNYVVQPVENYLPRYSTGPYLTYNNKFLYPNANFFANLYDADTNGFPVSVNYVVSIKEETVREICLTSGFGGQINNSYIVRASPAGNPSGIGTLMAAPFIPNDSTYTYTYDFTRNQSLYPENGSFLNQASLGVNLVNKNYVPNTSGCPQTNVNSTQYNSNGLLFNGGVKYTGQLIERYINTGAGGKTVAISVSEPIGGGLYWGYNGSQISGTLLYTPPVFDLETYSISPSNNLNTSMILNNMSLTNPVFSNNGSIRYGSLYDDNGNYNGKDPMFYQYVGGRSGVNAQAEGGYHSSGIIGDAWYNFNNTTWGTDNAYCFSNRYYYHWSEDDQYLFLTELTSGGMNIFARNMNYYPYYLNWQYNPYTLSTLPTNPGVSVTPRKFGSQYFFDFNLKPSFPLQSGIGSGINIGPFDRDVELCVTGRNSIIPSGYLLIDGEIVTNPNDDGNQCVYNNIEDFNPNSGIVLNQAGRNKLVSTFKLIPSGSISNINISGTGIIGLNYNSIVTIRPRTCFGAVDYSNIDTALLSGDASVMDNFLYITNGTESEFNFPMTDNISSLAGSKIALTTTPRIEVLFPIPGSDFDAVLNPSVDAFGNKTYSQANPTQYYWSQKTPGAMYSGIRETTRIYLHIDSLSVNMGQIPYQVYQTIIPSGTCTISGRFAYTGQAESSILTDGIVLSGISGASSLTGIFTPVYVSDVMQRIPSGIEVLPSGSGIGPVLPAPSYMKKRKNYFQITGGDAYIETSPIPTGFSYYYNAFLWPAWSDLALLNPGVVYEAMPPDDGNTFLGSYLTFSACQGQNVGTGYNPIENVTYGVTSQWAFLDGISTNALYNTGKCIFSGAAGQTTLTSGNLSGILTAQGNSLTMAINLG